MKKYTFLFYCIFSFCFITASIPVVAQSSPNTEVISNTEVTDDVSVLKEYFTKIFGPEKSDGFTLLGIKVARDEGGQRTLSGPVSMFGKAGIQLEVAIQKERNRPASVKINFPASCVINLNNIDDLTGGSIRKYIPNGFPVEAGVAVKYLNIFLDSSGYKPSKIETAFTNNQPWELLGAGTVSVTNAELVFIIENPSDPARIITGKLNGSLQVAGAAINLNSELSNDKKDFTVGGSINNLTVKNLLDAIAKNSGAGAIINSVPEMISGLQLSSLEFSIMPFTKTFTGKATSSIGEVEIMMQPGKAGSAMQIALGIAPPSSFRFSSLSPALTGLDAIDFSGTGLVISSFDGEMESGMNSLKATNGENKKIKEGLNVFSKMKPGPELASFLKVNELNIYGFVDKQFNNISLAAAFDFGDLALGTNIYLRQVAFGIKKEGKDFSFGLSGRLDATIAGDVLSFNAGFDFSPTAVSLEAFFYMEALKKANQQLLQATMVNGLPEPPEWTEPFGIPGVGIRKLGASIGVSPKSPVFLSSLGFDAEVRLGTVADHNKHFTGRFVTKLDIANPSKSLIDVQFKNLTIIGLLDAFKENHGITGELRTMLDWGLEEAYLRVVPEPMEFLGRQYQRGIAAGGKLKLAGLSATMDFSFNESGISFHGDIDPIEYKSGSFTWFALKGFDQRPKAVIDFQLNKDNPSLLINGSVTVLGINANTNIQLDKTGVEFHIDGNVLNGALSASLDVKAKSLSETGGFYVKGTFKNDLQSMVAQQLIDFITEASKASQEAYTKAQNSLKEARAKQNDPAAQFFIDAANSSVSAFKEIDKGMAVAGQYVANNMINNAINIKEISFETSLTKDNLMVSAHIYMIIAGQTINQTVSLNLNISSITEAAKQIVDQVGSVVISAFENLGSDIEKGWNEFTAGATQFFNQVGQGFVDMGKEIENAGAVAVNWISGAAMTVYNWGDETFNGAKVESPAQGNAPSMIPYTVTRYKITTNWIRCDKIPKALGLLGENYHPERGELEIFGNIQIIPGGKMWTNGNSNQYSFNKRIGDAVTINEGQYATLNEPKYFYSNDADAGSNNITLYCHLLESDYPLFSSEMKNQATFSIGGLLPGQSTSKELFVTDGEQGVMVSMTVEALPKISNDEMLNAVNSRNSNTVNSVIHHGGNPTNPSLIQTAIRNDDANSMEVLVRYGARISNNDLQDALQIGANNAIRFLIQKGVAPGINDLNRCIELKNVSMADLILKTGVVPNSTQVNRALQLQDNNMVNLLLSKGILVTEQELQLSLNQQNAEMMERLMKNGAVPTSEMLVQTIQARQTQLAKVLLQKISPTQAAMQEAANQNDAGLFSLLTESNGRLENNGPVYKAIDNNNRDIVNLALKNGGDPSLSLTYALQKNNIELAKLCLDNKANPSLAIDAAVKQNNTSFFTELITKYNADENECLQNAITNNNTGMAAIAIQTGKTRPGDFIISASNTGNEEMVKLLIENGADPNKAMKGAIAKKQAALVTYLIGKNASVFRDEYVVIAAQQNSVEIMRLLVENGADPGPGMPVAVSSNFLELTGYLLEKGAGTGNYLETAATAGFTDMVKLLISKGANPDKGMPPAVNANNTAMVKILLDGGANPQGYIATAATKNNLEMVNALLAKGANPNPGMRAAVDGNFTPVVKALLDNGAGSISYIAKPSSVGNLEMVQLLLDKNGDASEGIEAAIKGNFTPVISLLITRGANGNKFIAVSSKFGNAEIVQLLLTKGARAEDGIKASVEGGSAAVTEILINAGADGSKKEYMELTVAKNFFTLVPVLVKAGNKIDSTVTDANGKTYLHLAANRDNNFAMVKALLDAGASVFATDMDGNTPLHLAVDEGRDDAETVRILLEKGADPCAVNKKGRNIFKQAKGHKVKKMIKDFGGSRKCKDEDGG